MIFIYNTNKIRYLNVKTLPSMLEAVLKRINDESFSNAIGRPVNYLIWDEVF